LTQTLDRPTREQFDALVGPHLPCMLRAARRVLGTDDLAWDAVQETLLRFWRNGRIPAEPRPALLRVVRPTCLQILRARRRRRLHEDRASADLRGAPHTADCADPACAHERREQDERLRAAIAALPPACRAAFALRVEHGDDYRAIAARLRIPIGTVRSRIARARELLRARLTGAPAADEAPGICGTSRPTGEPGPHDRHPAQVPRAVSACPR
jgi:RNA polymerase sigma-70 factor (ECF subfamily)